MTIEYIAWLISMKEKKTKQKKHNKKNKKKNDVNLNRMHQLFCYMTDYF